MQRSVDAFLNHASVNEVVVALPQSVMANLPSYLAAAIDDPRHGGKPVKVVAGGERRQDSVRNAFAAVDRHTDIVLVHDAARPFVSSALVSRMIAATVESGAAVAAVAARDTVKQASSTAYVSATLPREHIYLAQTPQGFRRSVLADALALGANAGIDATDEATLAERAGYLVRIVDGETTNIKITTPDDMVLAEAIVRAGEARDLPRVGIGYDLHRLVEGRPLILGGVTIPFERGLAGHSDADALCHAVTDAVLGAAGAGDIGRHFPDTDARWKGASSIDLLRRAAEVLAERGLEVGNLDATVILERPKLAPLVDVMRQNVADAVGISIERVSIKGKTNEGVAELGRGEAIAVHAIAMVRAISH